MMSPDLVEGNINKLAELFPTVITESFDDQGNLRRAVDFDLLRQELSDHLVEGPQERYGLDWPGKRAAILTGNAPIAKTLRPMRDESVNFDTTENLFIEGDNLDALKLLQESYLGRVKMIYIDPPYNTGSDLIYEDDFVASSEDFLRASSQTASDGARLVANLESSGRFHSDWLSMIYPRLKLARNLLTQDGVIFISINDAEFGNLFELASEIFGAKNFVGTMVWAAGRKNDSKYISSSHEYILCFARNLAELRERGVNWKVKKKGLSDIYAASERFMRENAGDLEAASRALKHWYSALPESSDAKKNKHYWRIDQRGVYFADNISWPGGGGPSYEVLHPVTGLPVKTPSRGWLFQEATMKNHIADGRVLFGDTEDKVPTFKRYLKDTETEVPYSVFYQDGRAASKRLRTLMGAPVFTFPKDEYVLQTLVEMTTGGSDIIMDFFAGSGTTAHAVMAQNAEDGGCRRFMLVQLDERPSETSTAAQAGYESIAQIARERIRRAGRQIASGPELHAARADTGFRTLKVDSTNLVEVFRTPDQVDQLDLISLEASVKEGRAREDLLFQVLLDWGLELSLPIDVDEIDGNEIFAVEDQVLIACFDGSVSPGAVREIAKREPLRAVFLDSAFGSDAARINAEQIFREISPMTEVRTI